MIDIDSVGWANKIYRALLEKRALKDEDTLVTVYKSNEFVRQILKNRCKVEGTDILLGKMYLHLVVTDNSLYATNFSQLREKYYAIENRRYLYLLGLLHLIFFSEANNEASSIEWLHNGISYYSLIDEADKVFNQLYERQLSSKGDFSKKFSIAIDDIYQLWRNLDIDSRKNKIVATKKTKVGLVHMAMKILEDEGLVFIRMVKSSAEAVPTWILLERLELQYSTNIRYQEIKNLILNIKDDRKEA